MTATVLVVEDDRAVRRAVVSAVEAGGYTARAVADGLAAAQALAEGSFDVVLLDLGLPFVDGWRILAGMESGSTPSVIVISARGEEGDKVRALDMGADDYLAKPFGAEELVARIRAVLRRARVATPAAPAPPVRCGDVIVDLATRTVRRSHAVVHLSPTEYALLAELAGNPGVVHDHRTLLRQVWGAGYAGELGYLRAFVHRLRVKLERDPARPEVIVTVGRQGYRLGPPAG